MCVNTGKLKQTAVSISRLTRLSSGSLVSLLTRKDEKHDNKKRSPNRSESLRRTYGRLPWSGNRGLRRQASNPHCRRCGYVPQCARHIHLCGCGNGLSRFPASRSQAGRETGNHARNPTKGETVSARQRLWAQNALQTLIIQLGNKCSVPGCKCLELEIDHIQGRDWEPSKKELSWRISIYRKEFQSGKLQLLCKHHNTMKGNRSMQYLLNKINQLKGYYHL